MNICLLSIVLINWKEAGNFTQWYFALGRLGYFIMKLNGLLWFKRGLRKRVIRSILNWSNDATFAGLNRFKGWFTLAFLPSVLSDVFVQWPKISKWLPWDVTIWKIDFFYIFQTAESQGFPVNLPWLKYISMAKTSNENAGQKRQCKPALI